LPNRNFGGACAVSIRSLYFVPVLSSNRLSLTPYSANGRFFSKTIRISLGKKDQFFFQGEISLTKIVRREQNHLPQKFGPAHENTGAATTKRC
jgi:hypothetical protein